MSLRGCGLLGFVNFKGFGLDLDLGFRVELLKDFK